MNTSITTQMTPNPNALKFIMDGPVIERGNVTYKRKDDCQDNPLALALFQVAHVTELYFFDNFITVTQDGQADWDELEKEISAAIQKNIANHQTDFPLPRVAAATTSSGDGELDKINAILDQTVRPALQIDGGDLRVISLEGNTLKISYQGACGCCPHAALGTLSAIENVLREEYNPQIVVEMA